MDIEELERQKREILDKRKKNKNEAERKALLFAEYSRILYKIKYYNNEDFKKNEIKRNREYNKIHNRRQCIKDYYKQHKAEDNILGC